MAKANGKSPYAKYNKHPYRYSQLYQDWKAARNRGDTSQANLLAQQHTQRYLGITFKIVKET